MLCCELLLRVDVIGIQTRCKSVVVGLRSLSLSVTATWKKENRNKESELSKASNMVKDSSQELGSEVTTLLRGELTVEC